MNKKSIVRLILSFILLLNLLGSTSWAASQEIKLGIGKDENALNPYTYVTGSPGLDLVSLVYDSLFILDQQNQPIPWLVKDFSISEDKKKITMKLHENLKWHDGKSLTSEDVKFTYEYVAKYKKARFTTPAKVISTIATPDAQTVIFELSKPAPDFFIQPLADLPILPKHVWNSITEPLKSTEQMGSGPFIMVEHKQGQYYKLKANPDYFKGKPTIDSLILPIIEDSTAMFTALKSGQLDVASREIPPELVKDFENNKSLRVTKGTGLSTTLLQFNSSKYPLSEKAVREAISLSIDPKVLVETVLLGFATPGSPGFIHPDSPSSNKEIMHLTNIEKAKEILEQAGFRDQNQDGFREAPDGKKIQMVILVYSDSPIRIRTAEIVTESMKKLGLNVQVKAMDPTTVDSLVWPDFDVLKGRDFDMSIWSWSTTMQMYPARLTDLFYSNLEVGNANIGAFKSESFDKLADQLMVTLDPQSRTDLIRKMQQQVAVEYPLVPLYYEQVMNAYNPEAYDKWVFQNGKGIINKLSFVPNAVDETTKQDTVSKDKEQALDVNKATDSNKADSVQNASSGKGMGSIIVLLIMIVVVFAGIVLFSKKRKKR